MENIAIINFSKGPFVFNSDLFISTPKDKLNLSVVPRLTYSSNSDYVGLQLDITILTESTQVLKARFLIGMIVKGWSEMLKSGINLTNERHRLLNICQVDWFFATGVIALQTTEPGVTEYILLPINMTRFAEEVLLICSDGRRETQVSK